MALINILLRDNRNKICSKILSLREETELLISGNINAINQKNGNADININTIDFGFSTKDLENQGWTIDDGLYDKLIIQYNSKANGKALLTRWI
jgi:hypothetical protein